MALSYKARKRWSLFVLMIGLPVYIAAIWYLMSWLEGWPVWLQLVIGLVFSIIWVFPLKAIFLGVGKADPDAPPED